MATVFHDFHTFFGIVKIEFHLCSHFTRRGENLTLEEGRHCGRSNRHAWRQQTLGGEFACPPLCDRQRLRGGGEFFACPPPLSVTARRARCYGRTAAELVVATVVDREEWVQAQAGGVRGTQLCDMICVSWCVIRRAWPTWWRQHLGNIGLGVLLL